MGPTVIYMLTVVAGQATSLLLLPVITQFLPPEQFGEYSLVLATTSLIGMFGSSWVRNVGMRLYFDYASEHRSAALFWTAATLQASAMGVLLLAGYVVVTAFGNAMSPTTYLAGAVSVLVADVYALSINTLRAGQRAAAFGASELASALLRLLGTWAGLVAGFQSPAMLFVFATLSVAAALVIALSGVRRMLSGPIGFDVRTARELVRLGVPSIPQSVGWWVVSLADRALLALFVNLHAVGVYSVAYSVADRAVTGLATGLFMTAWPAILQTWSLNPAAAPAAISRYLGIYVVISVGPAVLLILQRSFVLDVLTSDAEYVTAANVIPYVVGGAWLTGLSSYLNRPLELMKRYGTLSGITMTAAAINLTLNLWLIPAWGVAGAAFSTLCATAGLAILSAAFGTRVSALPVPWRAIRTAGGATVAAAAVSMAIPLPALAISAYLAVYITLVGAVSMRRERVRRASARQN